jgi:hypothetical protein
VKPHLVLYIFSAPSKFLGLSRVTHSALSNRDAS